MKRSIVLSLAGFAFTALPAGAQEGHAAGGGGPLTVEGGLMFWTILVFLVLLGILKKFAWPAILGAVEAREKALEAQLAEAERNRAESARLLDEHRKLLADAKAQARAIVTGAHNLTERERAVTLEKVKHEQDELLARARREIQEERERAVQELRREAVDLSLAAAGKLINERLDSDTDRKLVMNYLSNLDPRH
jgi:F-type H+-transporting ATPase subunit b